MPPHYFRCVDVWSMYIATMACHHDALKKFRPRKFVSAQLSVLTILILGLANPAPFFTSQNVRVRWETYVPLQPSNITNSSVALQHNTSQVSYTAMLAARVPHNTANSSSPALKHGSDYLSNTSHVSESGLVFLFDRILALQYQMEEDAHHQQLAQQSMSSLFRGNLSNDNCLEPPDDHISINGINETNGDNVSVASAAVNASSNVDSLIRLRNLGVPVCQLDPILRARIAPWSNIAAKYGDTPRVVGLDRCHAFQQTVPNQEDRWLAVAGMFNSGTNLLFTLLSEHCDMRPVSATSTLNRPSNNGIAWQVSWGKHYPVYMRRSNLTTSSLISTLQQLPIVMIRHPYPWAKSMCRQPYGVTFLTTHGNGCLSTPSDHSESPQNMRINVSYGNQVKHYASLLHLYQEWYGEYLYNVDDDKDNTTSTFPRLMVRLEDLVYHPKIVLHQVCECAGGRFHWNMTTSTSTTGNGETQSRGPLPPSSLTKLLGHAKQGKRGHGNASHSLGFLQGWVNGGELEMLASNATRHTARQALESRMMQLFHYQL